MQGCCDVLQIANVSSGAGSLAGKVKFVEDAEIRKTLPYATQAMAYKMSKVLAFTPLPKLH